MGLKVVLLKKQSYHVKVTRPIWRLPALLFFYFSTLQLNAQHQLHQFWEINIEDGLVNNIVNDITQDRRGYTWIGTSGGLQKFDGMNFVTFTTSNSNLPSNTIQKLYCDDANVMWIVTPKGICKYDAVLNDITPSITGDDFTDAMFFEDAENRAWINAQGKLWVLDVLKSSWKQTEPVWTPKGERARFIVADGSENKIWIATQNNLHCYNNNSASFENVLFKEDIRTLLQKNVSEIKGLEIDKHHHLLISIEATDGTSHSASLDLTNDKWQLFRSEGKESIHDFFTTVEGKTWALGENILQLTNNEWSIVKPLQEEYQARFQSTNALRTICENRDGSLWIGTNNGIFIFTPQAQQFSYFTNPLQANDKPSNESKLNVHIIALNDSSYIIARNGATPVVTKQNFQEDNRFKKLLSLIGQVSSLHKDVEGHVWATNNDKLFRIQFSDQSISSFPLPGRVTISKLTSDKNTGDLWMITADGRLLKFAAENKQFIEISNLTTRSEFKVPLQIEIFNEHNLSTLWITFDQQIVKFNITNGDLHFFNFPGYAPINQASDFDKFKLLLASDDGLFFFDKTTGSISPIYSGKEPFNNAVAGVSIDVQKNIWAATKGNGLYKISSTGKEARRYGTNEGVVYRGFSSATNISIHAHRMAIVSTDGILTFDPLHSPGPLFNPRVQITSFIVNEKEQINNAGTETANLKWNENNVRIGFSSMSYLYNDQTTFSFKLEGHDREWTKVMRPEIIKYSNLQPGEYTFHIRCMAATGEVMSDEATLSFSIVAPFWRTLTFRLSIALLVLMGVGLFFYIRHVRRRNIQEIKNKISRDLHDHIGSSLSSISLMLNVAETKMQSNPQQSSALLKKIENTAQLTQENLHDIVWSIQNEKNSMSDIIDRMEEFYVSLFEGQSARIEFEVDPAVRSLNLDLQKRYNLYLLFKEIVNNGAKYSKATRVTTALRKIPGTVILSYEDNGIGFSTNPPPEGNGLANMKQRAAAMGGSIEIQSSPGQGTQIELKFPK